MIKSMTGFAKKDFQKGNRTWRWELKSLNSRYLDMSFSLPEHLRELEMTLREKAKDHMKRGKLDAAFHYRVQEDALPPLVLDQHYLNILSDFKNSVQENFPHVSEPTWLDILQFNGVLTIETEATQELTADIISSFEETLEELNQQRHREGEKLKVLLEERLVKMENWITRLHAILPEILFSQKERLLERFNELKLDIDQNRLEQEVVFLAQKMDVDEELDRLKAHITEVRRLLDVGSEVGKSLDFFMQELNREANTLGSKSVHATTTQASVELKVLIDQMREQIQNIE